MIAFVVWQVSKTFIKDEPTPDLKVCPFCKEANAADATRCKTCTSEI